MLNERAVRSFIENMNKEEALAELNETVSTWLDIHACDYEGEEECEHKKNMVAMENYIESNLN